MLLDILKGFLIGICASAPLGPVAIYIMQKTLCNGRRVGFLTSLGATLVDTCWAALAIIALALVQQFISDHETIILIVGGAIIIGVGLVMVLRDPFRKMSTVRVSTFSMSDLLGCVVLDLSNPGAIFLMFALSAFFGVHTDSASFSVLPVILAVSAGSIAYWFTLTLVISRLRRHLDASILGWINKGFGVLVSILGIALLLDGLMVLFRA